MDHVFHSENGLVIGMIGSDAKRTAEFNNIFCVVLARFNGHILFYRGVQLRFHGRVSSW
jgi:hypothetical protein